MLSRPPPLTPPAEANSSTDGTVAVGTRWMLIAPPLPRAGVRVTSVVSSSTGTLGPDDAALYVPFDCGACCAIAGDST
ncbi:hypothetical protein GLX27_000656 [Malassezia furfur]|uniref:Uncharacterized protein n=1 Tax=Malassezia furfur TaxID=55194 RepID=A0ABY8EKA2_MALFU|nr:hypothetical protein GLX27_000656 [Malassezia furfur]